LFNANAIYAVLSKAKWMECDCTKFLFTWQQRKHTVVVVARLTFCFCGSLLNAHVAHLRLVQGIISYLKPFDTSLLKTL
jgi:hypothetical protein